MPLAHKRLNFMNGWLIKAVVLSIENSETEEIFFVAVWFSCRNSGTDPNWEADDKKRSIHMAWSFFVILLYISFP